MNPTVRLLEGEEMWEAIYNLGQYAFHASPPFEDKEEWMAESRERQNVTCCAVVENNQPMAVAVSTTMTQNVRGALYPTSGVWGVATHPAARRKGYCRQSVASLLAAEREAGKVFSNLYPFRESFYERLGYIAFPLTKKAHFLPQALSPLLKMELEGEIELKLISECFETYREYLESMRQTRHGMAMFDAVDPGWIKRTQQWVAAARFDGVVEGIMLYSLEGEKVMSFNFSVARFYYRTSRARYLLLNWIARHVDQADRVEMWLPADTYPETWLSDFEVKTESAVRPGMCRVLDVEKLSGMSVGEGGFTARVIDPHCPWNQGDWQFEACDGKLLVSRASYADCELTIQGLSALIAGAHNPEDFTLRGWGNPNPEQKAALRRLFPALCPFMHQVF